MFTSIIGHEFIKPRLSSLVKKGNKTGTYLFFGPPSVGKRTMAFDIARHILCVGESGDDCSCRSCKRFGKDHPDFLCIGQNEKIKVSDADTLLEFAESMPFISDGKVAVIDNADDATWEASNRLLKTLEEPRPGFSFFLVSSDAGKILPTVRSRCIEYVFETLSQQDVINIIWKKMGFDLPQA